MNPRENKVTDYRHLFCRRTWIYRTTTKHSGKTRSKIEIICKLSKKHCTFPLIFSYTQVVCKHAPSINALLYFLFSDQTGVSDIIPSGGRRRAFGVAKAGTAGEQSAQSRGWRRIGYRRRRIPQSKSDDMSSNVAHPGFHGSVFSLRDSWRSIWLSCMALFLQLTFHENNPLVVTDLFANISLHFSASALAAFAIGHIDVPLMVSWILPLPMMTAKSISRG